ncbi:MAG: pilus assembly protein TadG-related protein, partial [Alphaproteobacteria bacterium]
MSRSFRRLLNTFVRRLREFGKSESGMTLPLLAMSMVMITGMVGMAIDTARAQLVQSKLQFSLDAAGLAASSTVNTSSLNTEVSKYLAANFNGYLGATVTGSNATADSTNTVITLTATAQLDSTFMGVVGIDEINVHANSQVTRSVTGLELIMVLDNTGSMTQTAGGGGTKLAALKSAANTLVDTLYHGQATAPPNLYIGIVPFSQAVNIGTSHPTWLAADAYNFHTTTWRGCVDARLSGYDITDDPPSAGTPATLFTRYYWPSDTIASLKSKMGWSTSTATTQFNNYSNWMSNNSSNN